MCQPGTFCDKTSMNSPIACTEGNYCPSLGLTSSLPCPAGSYCHATGVSAPTTCPAGSYCPASSRDPVPCPCGSYSFTAGNVAAADCSACPINSYMLEDTPTGQTTSNACDNQCPGNAGTLATPPATWPCGVASCKNPPIAAALSTTRSVFSNGISYACVIVTAVALGTLGYVVNGTRGKEARLASISKLSICSTFALSGATLVSEFMNLFVLFTLEFDTLAYLIVGMRVLHLIPSGYYMMRIFGMACVYDDGYSSLMDKSHFMENSYIYASVALLSLVEANFVIYLPWYYSEFADKSGGYPDMWTLRRAFYIKIFQSFVLLVCNVIFLAQSRALDGTSTLQALAVKGLFYINIASSTISTLLVTMNLWMRNSILKTVPVEKQFKSSFTASTSSDVAVELRSISKANLVDTIPDAKVVEENRSNPLHNYRESSMFGGPSTFASTKSDYGKRDIESDSSSTRKSSLDTEMDANGNPRVHIRQWILLTIPGIEASKMHAFAKHFEKLEILTYNDLEEFILGGALDVADIKHFLDAAHINRLKALNILREVENMTRKRVNSISSVSSFRDSNRFT